MNLVVSGEGPGLAGLAFVCDDAIVIVIVHHVLLINSAPPLPSSPREGIYSHYLGSPANCDLVFTAIIESCAGCRVTLQTGKRTIP